MNNLYNGHGCNNAIVDNSKFKSRSAIRFGGIKENKYGLCGVVPDVMQDETDFTA